MHKMSTDGTGSMLKVFIDKLTIPVKTLESRNMSRPMNLPSEFSTNAKTLETCPSVDAMMASLSLASSLAGGLLADLAGLLVERFKANKFLVVSKLAIIKAKSRICVRNI